MSEVCKKCQQLITKDLRFRILPTWKGYEYEHVVCDGPPDPDPKMDHFGGPGKRTIKLAKGGNY